ncbi:chromate efflux transporter [Halopseudomonas salegens]|uniref:Chromate transporter n=1 Tax=Halopseudomonas salegens TaxID=1434072 RepID=A0A1H2H090_9GAMM|nr:chromate efflux transporter [Halopseudomonas salegens]SDU25221.1 chromate transporter [Halopseudomonas salegens]
MNEAGTPTDRPEHPGFREAFWYWLKLGFISFGGPAGQISIMHQELVEKRRWISERRFLHALNFCMLLPGPEAQQLAIYLGWLLHRTWGGIVAGVLFVLPSLFILAGLTWIYLDFGDLTLVQGVFAGIKPAVVAIVLFAAWRIGNRALKNNVMWLLAAAAFVAIFVFDVPFPFIVIGAALLGMLGGRWLPGKFQLGGGHGAADQHFGAAVIDDDTPPLAHTRHSHLHLFKLVAIAVALWSLVILLLPAGTLTDMAIFFSKAALVTFGGAYAVLPYVYQGGVETYGWLSGAQMVDGLALGESTPGPLIMVVAFVGYVGGWTHAIFGSDHLFLAGFVAACVATFFTFLPSFVFILAGGPLVESTHGDLKFTAPLSAITAAVVGVILNLALFFGWHVLWPEANAAQPFAGGFEWFAALVALAAFIALWHFNASILHVLGVCAVLGLLHSYLLPL